MSQPSYVLNVENFDRLCKRAGIQTRSAFAEASGLPLRTVMRAVKGETELTMATVGSIMDTFEGTGFEHLFYRVAGNRLSLLGAAA